MNELAEVISSAVNGSKKTSGSDYVGTVTRVEDQTAYVQLAGSDIDDTPVAMTVSCKEGDTVRVRVANGRAWITGNDTAPATDDTEAEKRMLPSMENRDDRIKIEFGVIEFNGNTIVIDSDNFKLDEDGNATFSGDLSGASGSFKGTVSTVVDTGSGGERSVYINDSTKNAPIYIFSGNSSTYHYASLSLNQLCFGEYGYLSPYSSGAIYADSYMSLWGEGYWEYGEYGQSDMKITPGNICRTGNDIEYAVFAQARDNTTTKFLRADGKWVVPSSSSSDIRLKKDVVDAPADIAKEIKPVRFRFKEDDEKEHFGFIAQDVQKVLPDAVSEDENGYLSLSYQELIAPLYALVQSQQKQIENLEARLKALEDKLS